MTRSECQKELLVSQEFAKQYYQAHLACKKDWKEVIDIMKVERPGINIVLHHYLLPDLKYETWLHVIPMYNDEHSALHREFFNPLKGKNGYRKRGYKMSDEHKQKLSIAHKNIHKRENLSVETLEKMSRASKGRTLSPESRHKISEYWRKRRES